VSALSMSLCLLPYMGRDGLLKEGTFSARYLWWVDVLFKLWWGVVALGVPCSLYGSWWIELQYARLSGHLGILGTSSCPVAYLMVLENDCTPLKM
jgi:hypothetical protein